MLVTHEVRISLWWTLLLGNSDKHYRTWPGVIGVVVGVQAMTAERNALDERIARHRQEAAAVNGVDFGGAGGGDMQVDQEGPPLRKRARTEAGKWNLHHLIFSCMYTL
jgi:hypothetical protein